MHRFKLLRPRALARGIRSELVPRFSRRSDIMTEPFHTELQREIGELVKRELFEVGELRELEERLKIIAEKSSKMTPLPEPRSEED